MNYRRNQKYLDYEIETHILQGACHIFRDFCRNQKYLDYEIETWHLMSSSFQSASRNQKYLDYEIETGSSSSMHSSWSQ